MESRAELRRCPVCGGQVRRLRHDWLFVCSGCGLLASSLEPKIPAVAEVSAIDEMRRTCGLHTIRSRTNSVILQSILDLLRTDRKRLLDVGSGLGFFLKDAAAQDFDVTGIEPDANVVDEARKTGLAVRHGYFPACVKTEEEFDVIVFNDVFEHVPDVTETIQACVKHLAPNGILVLNCPNRHGIFYRISDYLDRAGIRGAFDRMWQRNLPSPHVWYFSPHDLASLGSRYGLEVVRTIDLAPVTLRGLSHRIFHVGGQSKIIGAGAMAITLLLLPVLSILPRDIGVVFFRKLNGGIPAQGIKRSMD